MILQNTVLDLANFWVQQYHVTNLKFVLEAPFETPMRMPQFSFLPLQEPQYLRSPYTLF